MAQQFGAKTSQMSVVGPIAAYRPGGDVQRTSASGSCPAGQIKRVIGGNHILAGGTKRVERRRDCVKR